MTAPFLFVSFRIESFLHFYENTVKKECSNCFVFFGSDSSSSYFCDPIEYLY